MAELSIRITIAGRVYPLTVSEEEEEVIRRSAKLINEQVKEYEARFSVRDKQDLLAMSALHFATELAKKENQMAVPAELPEKLSEIVDLIDSHLQERSA